MICAVIGHKPHVKGENSISWPKELELDRLGLKFVFLHTQGGSGKSPTFLNFILPKYNIDIVLFILHSTLGRWLINNSLLFLLGYKVKDNSFGLRAEEIMGQGAKERAELMLAL